MVRDPDGWLHRAKQLPITRVAQALGMDVRRASQLAPCPLCGWKQRSRSDRRPPIVVYEGSGWYCFHCREGGSSVDLVSAAVLGTRRPCGTQWADVRDWFRSLGVGDSSVSTAARAFSTEIIVTPVSDETLRRVPRDELLALWDACKPLDYAGAEHPLYGATLDFLARRRGQAAVPPLEPASQARLDLGRQLPAPDAYRWPAWWPAGWAATFRLVVLARELDGTPASLHGRAICEVAGGKTRWPRSPDGGRYSAGRLLFADRLGLELLRSSLSEVLHGVIIVEGLTDFLTTAQAVRSIGLQAAVLGGVSGSFRALSELRERWPVGVPAFAATDDDEPGANGRRPGDQYAARIAAALSPIEVRRARPNGWTPRARS
jgi:hypothetical protein